MNLNRVCNYEDWELLGLDEQPKRRKTWEVEMALAALADVAKPGADILGVGAGRERTIFDLCNLGARVWATDIYLSESVWDKWHSMQLMTDPAAAVPHAFDVRNLVVQHMDMRDLRFHDGTFDGVFSSGSIEHVGGPADIQQAAREIGRVLKPGGVASLSTEWRVSGREGTGWPGVVLFDEGMIHELIVKPSGLKLTGRIETAISEATLATAYPLEKFVRAFETGQVVAQDDVALVHDGYVFTSVHIVLEKPVARAKRGKAA